MAETRRVPRLGDLVEDRVTHLVGVVIGRTEHLNMCDRYTVQPRVSLEHPDKVPTAYSIDINDLTVLERNALKLSAAELRAHGYLPDEEEAVEKPTAEAPAGEAQPLARTGGPAEEVELADRTPVHVLS